MPSHHILSLSFYYLPLQSLYYVGNSPGRFFFLGGGIGVEEYLGDNFFRGGFFSGGGYSFFVGGMLWGLTLRGIYFFWGGGIGLSNIWGEYFLGGWG